MTNGSPIFFGQGLVSSVSAMPTAQPGLPGCSTHSLTINPAKREPIVGYGWNGVGLSLLHEPLPSFIAFTV